jgi:hypothetical protein
MNEQSDNIDWLQYLEPGNPAMKIITNQNMPQILEKPVSLTIPPHILDKYDPPEEVRLFITKDFQQRTMYYGDDWSSDEYEHVDNFIAFSKDLIPL